MCTLFFLVCGTGVRARLPGRAELGRDLAEPFSRIAREKRGEFIQKLLDGWWRLSDFMGPS